MNLLLAAGSIGVWLNNTFADFDMSVFNIFGGVQSKFLNAVAEVFSAMGATFYVALFALFGLFLCFNKRSRKIGLALVFAVIIGTLITNVLLKPIVLRVRPYNTLQSVASYFGFYQFAGMLAESDYSFPSGHSTGAIEIAIVLFLGHITSKKGRKFCWIFPIIGLLTCASRIYLMVHYATDVIAGIIVGLIAGIIGYILSSMICKAINRRTARKQARKPKKYIPRGVVAITFILAWAIMFVVAYFPQYRFAHIDDVQRCAYTGEYNCMNEAQTGEKYPAINGNYYCKIHWKEISEDPSKATAPAETQPVETQPAETIPADVNQPETTVPVETTEAVTTEAVDDGSIVIVDNDLVKIVVTGKGQNEYNAAWYGYKVLLTNKAGYSLNFYSYDEEDGKMNSCIFNGERTATHFGVVVSAGAVNEPAVLAIDGVTDLSQLANVSGYIRVGNNETPGEVIGYFPYELN